MADESRTNPEANGRDDLHHSGEAAPVHPRARFSWSRLIVPAVLVTVLILFFALGFDKYLSFDTLRENREAILAWTSNNRLLAVGAYMAIYIVVVAFSLPGGAIMTITGGFIFGPVFGTLWTVIGATIGATALFVAAKTSLGDYFRSRAAGRIKRMEEGFRENAFNYLLFLRLVPIFPFFLVNLAPAFLGVSLRTYVVATFVGIIPGTFIYALVGNGLGAIFDAGGTPNLGIIFRPEIFAGLIGLALLAVFPVIQRKIAARRAMRKTSR